MFFFSSFFSVVFSVAALAVAIGFMHYAQVDLKSFMEDASSFMKGEQHFALMTRDTEIVAHPAGFQWLFGGLYFLTNKGEDTLISFCIYGVLYLTVAKLLLKLYLRGRVSKKGNISLFLIKGIRSLYDIGLFNGCWATFFTLLGVLRLSTVWVSSFNSANRKSYFSLYWGSLLLSIGISINTNMLLFFPGVLCVLMHIAPTKKVVTCILIGIGWQLVAGAPFLVESPLLYVTKVFDFYHVFSQKSDNQNLDYFDRIIEGQLVANSLFLLLIIVVWTRRWRYLCEEGDEALKERALAQKSSEVTSGVTRESSALTENGEILEPREMMCLSYVEIILESNTIGVLFSQCLSYHFSSWIFFSAVLILYCTRLPKKATAALFLIFQYGFKTFPPTPLASAAIAVGLLGILVAGFHLKKRLLTEEVIKQEKGKKLSNEGSYQKE